MLIELCEFNLNYYTSGLDVCVLGAMMYIKYLFSTTEIPLGRIQLTEVEFSFIQEMTQRSNNNVGYCYTLVYYLNIEHNQYYLTNYDQVLCT